jgi:hypothetical protein
MLLNPDTSTPAVGLGNTEAVLGLPSRRFTGRQIKASLGVGLAWFVYQFANEIASSHKTFQQSPVATIAFLALALTVAAYVTMRQQADLVEQTPRPIRAGSGRGNGESRLGGRDRRGVRCRGDHR